jgi:hypothetical protein
MKTRPYPTPAVNNSFTEFHENLTNGLVADDVSQTDGRHLYTRPSFFFLDAFAKLRKAHIRFAMPVCPSAWNSWALTVRIFVKFDI